jgi:ArsR family transcriptional regulator, virulence genes transcriptional regulator
MNQLEKLKANAGDAADFLLLLANSKRLLILCELMAEREMSVGPLADAVGLSQSALSQHLAKLRDEGLVETRREAQTIFYRLARDGRVRRMLALLKDIFCK